MPTPEDIREARERIRSETVLTPCTPALRFGEIIPCDVRLKFENLQRTGSFKDRGAFNRLSRLTPEERERGIVTASAGNHAQAVAYHAGRLGIPATVAMPGTTPLVKVSNTRRYGAQVVLVGSTFHDAIVEARRLEAERGLVMIHAFDDDLVIAGQGTIGLEILEQAPDVTTIVVPIGGGGLISGIAIAAKSVKPSVRVIGVEAEAAPSAKASRDAGKIVEVRTLDTLADGIAVKQVGELTFPLIQRYVDDIVLVSNEEIASAILLLLEREKTLVEGAGAAGIAALMSGKIPVAASDVVVAVLCGGNIDINMISRIIDRGLVADGRVARLMIKVRDRPGALANLTQLVAERGANVMDIGHRRAFADITMGDVEIVMHLETRGRDHVDEIIAALAAQGHVVEEDA